MLTRFDALPNELLELISSFVANDERNMRSHQKRNIYLDLAHTNRRLRSFALFYCFSEVVVPKLSQHWKLTYVEDAGYGNTIRCLRLGSRDFARCRPPKITASFYYDYDLPRLPLLRELICIDYVLEYPAFRALGLNSRRLQHLSISWWHSSLPEIRKSFPQLKSLCLVLLTGVTDFDDSPLPIPNLTSLVICCYRISSPASFHARLCNLRVLALYNTRAKIREIFSIIQITPSLCEVTYRPDDLPDQEITLLGHLVQVIAGDAIYIEDPSKPSNDWSVSHTWRIIALSVFAFVRKPVSGPNNDSLFKYSSVSLSLENYNGIANHGRDDLSDILHNIPSQPGMGNIEELCLGVSIARPRLADNVTSMSFTQYMRNVAAALHHWPCLRRFAFAEDLAFCSWSSNSVPIIDDILLPNDLSTVADVQTPGLLDGQGYSRFESEIRYILGIPEDTELDPFIEILPLWEDRHEVEVAASVRRMATLCPTLRELVWYICEEEDSVKEDSWYWKIDRKGDGSVDRVLGSLYWSWPDSFRRPFPPFSDWSLVGEERSSAEKHGWPRTAFLR